MGRFYQDVFYTYSDVTIIPAKISNIEHRGECNPFDRKGMLPLFASPMDTVVSEENFEKFESERIYPILPRTVDLSKRIEYSVKGKWAAYSLEEFESTFCDCDNKVETNYCELHTLIDVANGHMSKIIDVVRTAKMIYGHEIKIMAGNIANPKTYYDYAYAGIDYVRVGIGSGLGCTTQSNVGVGCGMATLINKVAECKQAYCEQNGIDVNDATKIIADGGIRDYSDIIKALALGADYVMCGSLFCKMLESAAKKKCDADITALSDVKDIDKNEFWWFGTYNGEEIILGNIKAEFYGMASREGQIAMNGSKTKTSEGIKKTLMVEYTMHGWCENFIDFLRSSMSYVGVYNLHDFRRCAILAINSPCAIAAVNK